MNDTYTYDPDPKDPDSKLIDLEIFYSDADESTIQVHKLPDGRYLVGYLARDDDCSDPTEDNGTGYICAHDNHRSADYWAARGQTRYGELLVGEDDLLEEVAREVDKPLDDLLRETYLYKREQSWQEADAELKRIYSRANLKLPYRGIYDRLLEEHRQAGDLGDPDAVLLSYYEHGGRAYSLLYENRFPDQQWDVTNGGAVWIPDDHLRNVKAKGLTGKKRRAKMEQWARECVDTYNDWLSGDCWGVVVQTNDEDGNMIDDDACWGYIGSKWAKEELASSIKWALEHQKETA